MITPVLPAAPFQPTITPCSLENMRLAGVPPTGKAVVSLTIMPDAAPGPSVVLRHCPPGAVAPAGPGTLTSRVFGLPQVLDVGVVDAEIEDRIRVHGARPYDRKVYPCFCKYFLLRRAVSIGVSGAFALGSSSTMMISCLATVRASPAPQTTDIANGGAGIVGLEAPRDPLVTDP
jgi:hypothetical protein